MATENERLVTEAKLKTSAPGIVENVETGRRTLVFPTGSVEVGDTGWVDLRGALINGWTAETIMVRRQGNTTRIRIKHLDRTASTSSYFLNLPLGYGGDTSMSYVFQLGNHVRSLWVNKRSFSLDDSEPVNTSTVAEIVIPVESDSWPTTLGGPKL